MKRRRYNENRSELDQEAYRDGFLSGYQDGADAAIEYLQAGIFTYDEYGDPVLVSSKFVKQEQGEEWKGERPAWEIGYSDAKQRLAYEIGFSDAFDRGYHDTFKTVDDAFKQIRGISITDSAETAGD